MTTLKDVARAAGVDVSTVSRALSGDPRVAAATRERIAARAAALSYRPNEAARRLRAGATRTVWFLAGGLDNPIECEPVLRGVERLAAAGYDGLMAVHRGDPAIEQRLLSHLERGVADGAILIPGFSGTHPQVESLVRRQFPLVFLDRHPAGFPAPTVTTDNAAAVRALIAAGEAAGVARWVTFLKDGNAVARLRQETAESVLAARGRPWLRAAAVTAAFVAEGTVGLLGESDAEIAASPWIAGVPPERRVAVLFDRWQASVLPAAVARVARQDFAAMADRAVDRVLGMLAGERWTVATDRIPLRGIEALVG